VEIHVIRTRQPSYMFQRSKVGKDLMNHIRQFIAECVSAVLDLKSSVGLLLRVLIYCFWYNLLRVHTEAVHIVCVVRL